MGRLAHDGQVLSTPLIAVGIGVLLYALIAKVSTRTSRIETKRVTYAAEQGHDTRGALFAVATRFPDGTRGAQTRKGYVMDVTFYKCNHCGNVAVKPFDKKVPLSCCGEKMSELVANSTDAAVRSTFRRERFGQCRSR